MESPGQRRRRLTNTLGELVRAEAACVAAEDFAPVPALQQRLAQLIDALVEDPAAPADTTVATQIAVTLRLREQTLAKLAAGLAATESRLRGLAGSQRRVAQVAPTYRPASDGSTRLRVLG